MKSQSNKCKSQFQFSIHTINSLTFFVNMTSHKPKKRKITVETQQEDNHQFEMKVVKNLLDWCLENDFFKNSKKKGPQTNHDNLLHWACQNGHLQIVEHLMTKDQFNDVNSLGSHDETPLHKAVEYGHSDVVKFLIDKGAHVNAKNGEGKMPIHVLADEMLRKKECPTNGAEVAKILIEKGAYFGCKNSDGETPLHLAINSGLYSVNVKNEEMSLEIIKVLIEKGANVDARNTFIETPLLIVSAQVYNPESIKPENWFQSEVAKLLLEKGARTFLRDKNSRTPLHIALDTGNNEVAKLLISKEPDWDATDIYGKTPLDFVSMSNDFEMVKLVLSKVPKQMLRENGEKLFSKWLCKAAARGHKEMCKYMISMIHGLPITWAFQDNEGNTPLHIVVKNCDKNSSGHMDVMKLLMEIDAMVNFKNDEGNIPLHFAKSKEVAELLIKNGSYTDCKNKKGQTPKDLSLENKAYDVNEIIIKYETRKEERAKNRAEKRQQNSCNICFEPRTENFVILPCGHAKTCGACCAKIMAPNNQNPVCPTCRQPVILYQKIFM